MFVNELGNRPRIISKSKRRIASATVFTMAASLLVAGPIRQAVADPDPQNAKATGPAVTTFPRPEDPDAALRAAVEEAKKLNKPVTVEEAFTETSRTWAYPDGHLTTESYSGPTQLRQRDGSWAWIDPSLVEQNGVLKPKLAKAKVRLSTGGSGPFATMILDRSRSFSLSWPTPLPKPKIEGNVATYPGVAGPSGDLVVTALATGLRHDIVLRERPTGPVEFRIPVESKGLKLSVTKSGGLTLKGDNGKKAASAPAPLMWDAAADKPSATKPGRQKKIETSVESKDGSTTLVLKPDTAWLADPTTQYPVTVDPTTTLGITQEVGVLSPNYQRVAGTVGRGSDYSGTGEVSRTLMAFDTAPIAGKQVTKATMQLRLREDVTTCSEFQGIVAQRITKSWVSDNTYWDNQPTSTEEGRAAIDPCALPGTSGAVWSWDLTAMTRLWASGTPNHGLLLKLTQETAPPRNEVESFSFWPQLFNQDVPKLSVDWVLPPEIPTVTAESIDSMDGNDAIARSTNVKVTYKSSVPEATPLNYTVTVNDSTMAPPAVELPGGEAAYWKLDETSGTTVTDSSGNNRNATLSGAHTRTPGQLGQAVTFTGGYAATSGPVINTNQSFTASAWVRLDNSTQEQNVLSQMGTNLPGFTLSYQTSDAPEYDQRWVLSMINRDVPDTIHETVIQSEHLAKIGEWTHVAAQYDKDAGKIRLYVDGVLAGERDHTVSWNARGAFEIGHSSALEGPLKGAVDDIHVYQRALSANELRALVGVPGTTSHNNIPSGQVLDKVFTLDNPASFKFVVKACRAGITPPSCNESPAYRITSDAPVLPSDTQTGMADPTQPILSGMVNRPSGNPVTAKYYLYDSTGAPVGSAPLGSRTVNGGERASYQVPPNTVQPGSTYKWQMVACVTAPQGEDPSPNPDPTPTPDPEPDPDPTPTPDPEPDPTPTPTPTPTGLVAAYGMNEGSGSTVNDVTGTNHGTAIGTSWVTGKYGKGLSFDGMFGLVTVDNHPSLRLSSGMTLSAWVKPSRVDDWYAVMGKDYETIDNLSYGLHASDGSTPLGWVTTQGVPKEVGGTSRLRVNTWSHLAVTYDGSRARLYLNGNQIGEERISGNIQNDSGDFHIGGNTIYGEYFDGVIDEVRVYNRAQTVAEITTDMNTPLGGAPFTTGGQKFTKGATVAAEDGRGSEACTSKTAPVTFTTPGTPPLPPAEDVRNLTLGKDSFVIKTAKIDPTACAGSACKVVDDTVIRIGGSGVNNTAAMIGFRIDELPDGAVPIESQLMLGTPACSPVACPESTNIAISRLESQVTEDTTISNIIETTNSDSRYEVNIAQPAVDIVGDQNSWLLLKADSMTPITFGDVTSPAQPSLTITYRPAAPPSKVEDITVHPGDSGGIVSWGLPVSTGSLALIEEYRVEVLTVAGEVVASSSADKPSITITGLTNGQTYIVRVAAKTPFGRGGWETVSLTPRPLATSSVPECVSVGTEQLKVTVQEYYLRQSGVVEGSYPDVWSSTVSSARSSGQAALDPRNPVTAKLSLTNPTLTAEKEGLDLSYTERIDTSVSIRNVLAYNGPDGSPTLRATVDRSWTDVTRDKDGNEKSKPTELTDTFDYSFSSCGHIRHVSVVVDVDVSDMDMMLDGSGNCGGAPSAFAQNRTMYKASSSDTWCGREKSGDMVYDYTARCDFGQTICSIRTYGKQSPLSGMTIEAGGTLRWSGNHNYILGGPTTVRVEELQGWVHVTVTPAFRAANKNLVKNLKINLSTIAKFSMTVGSVSVDTGGASTGFGTSSDSAHYSLQSDSGHLKAQIPLPGKIRPFSVNCEGGILGLCWFDSIRHDMSVTVTFPFRGYNGDPMRTESCWVRASTKYLPG